MIGPDKAKMEAAAVDRGPRKEGKTTFIGNFASQFEFALVYTKCSPQAELAAADLEADVAAAAADLAAVAGAAADVAAAAAEAGFRRGSAAQQLAAHGPARPR